MELIELPGSYAHASKRIQRLQSFSVVHPDSRWAPAGDIQETLRRVCRESNARRGVSTAAHQVRPPGRLAPAVDPYLRDKFSLNSEDLHSLSTTICDVDE